MDGVELRSDDPLWEQVGSDLSTGEVIQIDSSEFIRIMEHASRIKQKTQDKLEEQRKAKEEASLAEQKVKADLKRDKDVFWKIYADLKRGDRQMTRAYD